jgi:methylmalonyl-CoA/ethylmalonyl-CoA epimerase
MTLQAPHFHVGVVVADLESGMEEIARALGLRWGRVQRRQVEMEGPDGPVALEMAYAYSLDGPPHLELIERRAGSIFDTVGLHHVGVWTQDRPGESARLESLGWPRETVGLCPDGTWAGGLFHTGTGGLRVEVVDVGRSGPRLLNYLGGGDYTVPE